MTHPGSLGRGLQSWEGKPFDLGQHFLVEVVVEGNINMPVACWHPHHVDLLTNVVEESNVWALPPSM